MPDAVDQLMQGAPGQSSPQVPRAGQRPEGALAVGLGRPQGPESGPGNGYPQLAQSHFTPAALRKGTLSPILKRRDPAPRDWGPQALLRHHSRKESGNRRRMLSLTRALGSPICLQPAMPAHAATCWHLQALQEAFLPGHLQPGHLPVAPPSHLLPARSLSSPCGVESSPHARARTRVGPGLGRGEWGSRVQSTKSCSFRR